MMIRLAPSRRAVTVDTAVAVAVAILASVITVAALGTRSGDDRDADALAVLLIVAGALPLAARRIVPALTLGLTAAATATYLLVGYPYGPVFLALVVAVYSAARHLPMRQSALLAGATLIAVLAHVLTHPDAISGWGALGPATAWVAVPYAIGTTRRVTHEGAARERSEALREGVYAERLRVAHEVHDVVGHGLAAIQMQADIALHVLDKDPAQGRAALEAISRSSAAAMAELRTTLQVVQRDETPLAPAPGLDQLDALCRRIRDSGVQVDLVTSGVPTALPAAADLAAYRVVQESLTNVVRHASAPQARVEVEYADDEVRLRVASPGVASRPTSGGLGLEGMRRRVGEVGGWFAAGPEDDQFVTAARIPVAPVVLP